MAQAVGELTEQGSPAFEAPVPALSQLLKAETADREVRSTAYQLKAARFPDFSTEIDAGSVQPASGSGREGDFPHYALSSHMAPLGLIFYTGDNLPHRFRGGDLSASTAVGTGRRSTDTELFCPLQRRPNGKAEDVVTDFLDADGTRADGRSASPSTKPGRFLSPMTSAIPSGASAPANRRAFARRFRWPIDRPSRSTLRERDRPPGSFRFAAQATTARYPPRP